VVGLSLVQLETVAAVLSVLVPTLSSIAYTSYRTGKRFGAIEEKLRQFDGRFKEVDGRFGELKAYVDGRFDELRKYVDVKFDGLKAYVDEKFKEVDGRFNELRRYVDGRFEEVDGRFGELKGYVDGRLEELRKYVDGRFEEVNGRLEGLGERIDHRVGELGRAFSSYQEFLIEYLSVKGVVSDREALMLKNEAARVSRLAVVNPFTKEEWERLKMYLDRDVRDFTLEEAEDFRELGRKAIVEYPDKPEVYKLHMYATVVYGLTLRRVYEEKERKAA
jgi:tetrahydromethanopterin S-methyltransferase subunit G